MVKERNQPVLAVGAQPGQPRFQFFPSTRAAGRAGHDRRTIFKVVTGKRNHHHGLLWDYLPRRQAALWRAAVESGQLDLGLD